MGPKMCTGYFIGAANSPLTGTGCVYPCVYEMGRWGSSWCYTNLDKSEWGAECILGITESSSRRIKCTYSLQNDFCPMNDNMPYLKRNAQSESNY